MKQNHPVVLVRKRKSHHAAHHGGSWKIAYADFMTAMMAFFLVMWLLAIASPQELTQIAEYFRTPLKVALTSGDKSSSESSPIPGGGELPINIVAIQTRNANIDAGGGLTQPADEGGQQQDIGIVAGRQRKTPLPGGGRIETGRGGQRQMDLFKHLLYLRHQLVGARRG